MQETLNGQETEKLEFRMTDLEEKLAGDDAEAVRDEILKTLLSRGEDLKAKMDAGMAKDDFQKSELAYRALAAAHEIVANFPTTNTSN